MKKIEMISLDINMLKEINGGSQESYEAGLKAGEVIRKWLILCGIISLFLL